MVEECAHRRRRRRARVLLRRSPSSRRFPGGISSPLSTSAGEEAACRKGRECLRSTHWTLVPYYGRWTRARARPAWIKRMLRKEQNELLTQTGPGTSMGRMFRAYWLPALLVDELPENDCPPVRVKMLSERLLAFRDSDGRYGLIDEFCAHRGVSLWFGRNEE